MKIARPILLLTLVAQVVIAANRVPPAEVLQNPTRQPILQEAQRPEDISDEVWQRIVKMHAMKMAQNKPIQFYGKLLDQHDRPVSKVAIHGLIRATDPTYLHQIEIAESDRIKTPWTETSDRKGRFSVQELNGFALEITSLEKEGYTAAPLAAINRFSADQYPDEKEPQIFRMWKESKKTPPPELIEHELKVNAETTGQTHKFDLLSGSVVRTDDVPYDLAITIYRGTPIPGEPKYDWRLRVATPAGGGFQETHDLQPYQVPENGYQTDHLYSVHADDPRWSRRMERTFFIRNRDAQLHARVAMTAYAYADGAILIRINSVANEEGSRRLF